MGYYIVCEPNGPSMSLSNYSSVLIKKQMTYIIKKNGKLDYVFKLLNIVLISCWLSFTTLLVYYLGTTEKYEKLNLIH